MNLNTTIQTTEYSEYSESAAAPTSTLFPRGLPRGQGLGARNLFRRSVSVCSVCSVVPSTFSRFVLRRFLHLLLLLVLLPLSVGAQSGLSRAEGAFLDELERASFLFFWEAANPDTGLVKDRSLAHGPDPREMASIAATGFGLTALCIADYRGFAPAKELRTRVRATLRFLSERLTDEHGFFYHFLNAHTGERAWKSEVSSIDTALLLCGVLTCRQHFRDPEIRRLADRIYERVDWAWMMAGRKWLAHGWKPETGFLDSSWNTYCELMMLYLLAIGSPSHPIPAETWLAWERPAFEYEGLRYINPSAPLFIHQYSHAWFDFRGKRDSYADYFENSVTATRAHRLFCIRLGTRFPHFGEDLWGITASDSAQGYTAWGGPPEMGQLDGTLVPAAAGGSLAFLPAEAIRVLRKMRAQFGERVWKRYGFIDAFNPQTKWFDPDVIGIDVGITLLMAENARSGFVWKTFMKNDGVRAAMQKAGFKAVR